MVFFFVHPQEGRATVNQDTKLDNRVIDLRVSSPRVGLEVSNLSRDVLIFVS